MWTQQNLRSNGIKLRVTPNPSIWFSYIVVIPIPPLYFEIEVGKTYKMIHNNRPAEVLVHM